MIQATTKRKLQFIETAWKKHQNGRALARIGRQHVDNLFHALVPLYFTRADPFVGAVTSGDTSRFWEAHGVKISAPVVAKMWREHIGYSRRTTVGIQITPNGVKYVEAALKLA